MLMAKTLRILFLIVGLDQKHNANKIPQGFYIQLRREAKLTVFSFWSPSYHWENGSNFMLIGIDPVSMLQLQPGVALKRS